MIYLYNNIAEDMKMQTTAVYPTPTWGWLQKNQNLQNFNPPKIGKDN